MSIEGEHRFLGTLPARPAVHQPGDGSLLIHAMTCCCGAGIADVKVEAGGAGSKSVTDDHGMCLINDIVEDRVAATVSHPALEGGVAQYDVHCAVSNFPAEIPFCFDVHLFLFFVDGPDATQLVKATNAVSLIPQDHESLVDSSMVWMAMNLRSQGWTKQGVRFH